MQWANDHPGRAPPQYQTAALASADMKLATSPEQPAPVRVISTRIGEWVDQLGPVWLEGQIAQISRRPGMSMAWVTLRDVDVDMSLSVVTNVGLLDRMQPPAIEGQRVIVHGKAEVYGGRGTLQIRAREIRAVGLGALREELARLQVLLQAEGLFAAERKRQLPFLPRRVGLICGRASAALHDVVANATQRWPSVDFHTIEVAVQGVNAVTEVVAALETLNADALVDVVILARGGGSFEDLLPFSNERLIRAVSTSRAPVISAIGHENDHPLIDLVADFRASTPTDAAKRVVPDLVEQQALIDQARARSQRALHHALTREITKIQQFRGRAHRATTQALKQARTELVSLLAQTRALSPLATLERGYAVVSLIDPMKTQSSKKIVYSPKQVAMHDTVSIRVFAGKFTATRSPDIDEPNDTVEPKDEVES